MGSIWHIPDQYNLMQKKFDSIDNQSLIIIMIGGNDVMLFNHKGSDMWKALEGTIKNIRIKYGIGKKMLLLN